ncbi:MAG: hypothetical protein U9N10_08040 [Bacillota bacterium]|nr:hypothetical protein [Bacillota bacterium]
MKRIISIVILIVMILSLVACGGNDLIGKWEMVYDKEEEGDFGLTVDDLGIDLSITFTEDTMEMMGMSFDYKIKNGKIMVKLFGEEEEAMEFDIKGDKMILTSSDGEAQEFIRVKE